MDVWEDIPNNLWRGNARGKAERLLAKPLLELTGAFRERMMTKGYST